MTHCFFYQLGVSQGYLRAGHFTIFPRGQFSTFFSISENKLLKDKKDQLERELRNEQTQQNSGDSYSDSFYNQLPQKWVT